MVRTVFPNVWFLDLLRRQKLKPWKTTPQQRAGKKESLYRSTQHIWFDKVIKIHICTQWYIDQLKTWYETCTKGLTYNLQTHYHTTTTQSIHDLIGCINLLRAYPLRSYHKLCLSTKTDGNRFGLLYISSPSNPLKSLQRKH